MMVKPEIAFLKNAVVGFRVLSDFRCMKDLAVVFQSKLKVTYSNIKIDHGF